MGRCLEVWRRIEPERLKGVVDRRLCRDGLSDEEKKMSKDVMLHTLYTQILGRQPCTRQLPETLLNDEPLSHSTSLLRSIDILLDQECRASGK